MLCAWWTVLLLLALLAAPSLPGAAAPSRCASTCQVHGTCNEELIRCDCLKGFRGTDCSQPMTDEERTNASRTFGYRDGDDFLEHKLGCLNACNNRGTCQSGVCHCSPGYYGADCSMSVDAQGRPQLLMGTHYVTRARRPHVYVYELPPELTSWYNNRRVDRPLHYMFWQRLLSSGARVADGSKADWFFIPLKMRTARDGEVLLQALAYIRETWPWYNQTQGANHFLFHMGDTGAAELARPAAEAGQNLTWLTHWGLYKENEVAGWREAHVPGKDVVVPVLFGSLQLRKLGLRTSPHHPLHDGVREARQDLLFFGGRICGDRSEPNASFPECVSSRSAGFSGQVRQRVFHHHYNRSGFVMTTRVEGSTQHVTTTRFCLAPPGSGHGYRQILVAMLGCIPVVVGDYINQPFEPELDWSQFAVQPSEAQIPQLHQLLEEIKSDGLAAMRANLKCAAEHFSYSSITGGFMGESGRYDAFETILEILRVKKKFPNAAPYEYVYLDAAFARFMNCGGPEAMSLGSPVMSAEVPGWGLLPLQGVEAPASGARPGRRVSGTGLSVSAAVRAMGASLGSSLEAGRAVSSSMVCSHSRFDRPEVLCRRCYSSRSLTPAFGLPGGFICCGAPSLAECTRLWS